MFLTVSLFATLLMHCDARADLCAPVAGVEDEAAELVLELPSDAERAEVYAAIDRCDFRTRWDLVDPWMVLALLRLEHRLLIPEEHKGLLPAVWCIEASMRTESRAGGPILGDYRDGYPISQGPFQIQKWMARDCGGTPEDRHDLLWAARCWVTRIHRVVPKAERYCSKRVWVVAEAMVSNPRKYRWDCRATSKHYSLLKHNRT